MNDCKDFIKETRYRNWVKCTLGIEQTSKAVCEYVSRKFSMYLERTATLNNPVMQSYLTEDEFSHFRDEINSEFRYNLKKFVRLKNEKWYWSGRCQKCQCTLAKLLCLHKSQKDIHWKNCDDTRTLSPEWALAKIFMPMGNEKNKGPDDTDPSAIFIVMKMCDLFMNPIKAGNINGIIDARNELFHSPDSLVEPGDLENYFTHMENLVSDALNDPDNDEDLKRSIGDSHNKIVKLKESEMTLTLFEDAQKAMRIKRTAIYYDFEQYLCDNDLEQLKTILKFAEQVTTITDSQQDIKANDVDFQKLEERLKEKSKVLQEDIANINTKFRYSEDRVNVFKTQNIEKQEEITSNNAKIRILEDKLHNEIANKNDTISDLKERINDRTNINGILQKELANNKEVIRVLEDKLNIKEEQINGLQEEILKNKDTITNILQLKKNREIDSLKLKIFATACLAAVISVVYLGLRKS